MNHRQKRIFEAWARWCVSGTVLPGNTKSIMALLIENKGQFSFSSSGATAPIIDSIECAVESLLSDLYKTDPKGVVVIRSEYLGRYKDEDNTPITRLRKASCLGMSLRTYERRLSKTQQYVLTTLNL